MISKEALWILQSAPSRSGQQVTTPVSRVPFVVGRVKEADLTLPVSDVSRLHAEISLKDGVPWITDLDSSNGTFVNHKRIDAPRALEAGDILHFASVEFRLMVEESGASTVPSGDQTIVRGIDLAASAMPVGLGALRRALIGSGLTSLFQSIVSGDGNIVATEALGRGASDELSSAPTRLLHLAESGGLERDLSARFRQIASELAFEQAPDLPLFVNTHPNELLDPDSLVQSLQNLPHVTQGGRLVLEVHENGLADPAFAQQFKESLAQMQVGLAYDDFGAGQSRLRELVESPPDYLKLDMGLIRDIDTANAAKQRLIASIASTAADLGVDVIAEGVETAAELACCRDMGIPLYQGFYFSKPHSQVR